MFKSAYCFLLLLISCLIYNAYGNYHKVRRTITPSHAISNNIDRYDSSSSFTSADANGATEDTTLESAAASPSPRPSRKSLNSYDSLRYKGNRGLDLDNKSRRGMQSRQKSYNMENSDMMNSNNPFNGHNIVGHSVSMSFRKCCYNGECRMLKDGEDCGVEHFFKNMKNTPQPKNTMFVTSSNGDNDFHDAMSKLMDSRFKSFRLNSFNRFGNSFDENSNTQETRKPTNMRLGLMRYPTTIPSFDSSNDMSSGMGSFVNMPQKRKPINYQYSSPIGLSEDEANEIRNKVLQQSNLYRKKYNLIPFTLDDQLNNCAQDWANNMAKQGTFQHRDNNAYGENLYADLDLNNLGVKAVDTWYNEITKFNIDDNESELGSNTATHHMTQLLWKSSTKLGVGVSQTPNGMYNVVANYDPTGNMIGSFKDNLPQIKQEDIEEASESERETQSAMKSSGWSSDSSFPFQSEWNNNDPYYN